MDIELGVQSVADHKGGCSGIYKLVEDSAAALLRSTEIIQAKQRKSACQADLSGALNPRPIGEDPPAQVAGQETQPHPRRRRRRRRRRLASFNVQSARTAAKNRYLAEKMQYEKARVERDGQEK